MTSSEAIKAVSGALYGCWSPARLGGDLGVSERTVRRWGVSEWPVPAGALSDCLSLLAGKSAQIECAKAAINALL